MVRLVYGWTFKLGRLKFLKETGHRVMSFFEQEWTLDYGTFNPRRGSNCTSYCAVDFEGQLYATTAAVLWRTIGWSIGWILRRDRCARGRHALKGSHPVVYGEQVAWIEWGEEMGVSLDPVAEKHTWISSPYPSSLVEHHSELVWVSEGKIVLWSSDSDMRERPEKKIKEVFYRSVTLLDPMGKRHDIL